MLYNFSRAVRYREVGGGKYEIVDPTAALVDACFDKRAEEVAQASAKGIEQPTPAVPAKPAGGVAMPCMGTQSTLRPLDTNQPNPKLLAPLEVIFLIIRT